MGNWGTGIYQNDVSEDVKNDYIAKLKGGKSDEEALQEILLEYMLESSDDDSKCDFFLGLADTLWKVGRLTEEIKNKALESIEADNLSGRWKTENDRIKRKETLKQLDKRLRSQMPEPKRITSHKPYLFGWKKGEVYTFQIKNNVENYETYMGWYVLLYVDEVKKKDWVVKDVLDEVAEVYFFLSKDKPQNPNAIKEATPICFLQFNGLNQYRAEVFEKSKRQRPKDITLLGICSSFTYPANELPQKRHFSWSLHERDILWGYERQLRYEQRL